MAFETQQTVKVGGDMVAYSLAGATLMKVLPPVAAICSIVWFALQVFLNWPKIKERFKEVFNKGDK